MNAQPDYDTRDQEAAEERWVNTQCAGVPFTSAAAALRFILAGNAYFTLRSRKSGTRYTYRVRLAEDDNPNSLFSTALSRQQKWFVSLLAGPENTSDYVYLGLAEGHFPTFRLTRASKMTADSAPAKAIKFLFEMLNRDTLLPGLEIWHEGRCGRCGRMLTVPESITAGLGPDCAGRMGL